MGIITNQIDVKHLHPHPDNPRKDVGDVSELAKSIKANGIMQNLTVIPMDDEMNDFMVLIGHRRLAAAKMAGISEVPCKILFKDVPSRAKQIEIMLEENMQRNDLTVLEEAESFQLCLDLGETVGDLVNKTGFSETTIRRRLNVAKLDRKALDRYKDDDGAFQLSMSDLYSLEQVADVNERNRILAESTNGANLKYNVQEAIRKQEIKAREKEASRILFQMGFPEMPVAAKADRHNGRKYESVCRFDLRAKEMPEFKVPDKKPYHTKRYVFFDGWGAAVIYAAIDESLKRKEEAKKPLTDYEKKMKKAEANKRKLNEHYNIMKEEIRNVIVWAHAGKLKTKAKDEEILHAAWDIMIDSDCTYARVSSIYVMTDWGFGRKWYGDIKEAEKIEAVSLVKGIPMHLQIMYAICNKVFASDTWEYNGAFKKSTKDGFTKRLVDLLSKYYSYTPSKVTRDLLDGTCEYYTEVE